MPCFTQTGQFRKDRFLLYLTPIDRFDEALRAGFSNSLWRKQLRRRFGPTPFRPAAGAATKRNLQLLARQTLAAQNAPPTLTPVDMR
jgi:hypothetical protein